MPASMTMNLANALRVWRCADVCRTWFSPCQADRNQDAPHRAIAEDWSQGCLNPLLSKACARV